MTYLYLILGWRYVLDRPTIMDLSRGSNTVIQFVHRLRRYVGLVTYARSLREVSAEYSNTEDAGGASEWQRLK